MQREGRFLQTNELAQLKRRDAGALWAVYHANRLVLERAAKRLGFAGVEAEDLVHSTWMTFLDAVPRFEGRSQVRTFLLGILRREARSARRRARRLLPMPPDELAVHEDPLGQPRAEARELARAVDACVSGLGHAERRAVELKLLQGRETEHVRTTLGVSANYLGVLLHRARAHLRQCLAEHLA